MSALGNIDLIYKYASSETVRIIISNKKKQVLIKKSDIKTILVLCLIFYVYSSFCLKFLRYRLCLKSLYHSNCVYILKTSWHIAKDNTGSLVVFLRFGFSVGIYLLFCLLSVLHQSEFIICLL